MTQKPKSQKRSTGTKTADQLRHYLYRCIASELSHHAGNGSEWLFPDELSEKEHQILVEMLQDVICDFDVKVEKLGKRLDLRGKEPIK